MSKLLQKFPWGWTLRVPFGWINLVVRPTPSERAGRTKYRGPACWFSTNGGWPADGKGVFAFWGKRP